MKFYDRQILRSMLVMLIVVGAGVVACSPERAAQTHTVVISGFQFEPAVLHVSAGDTVVWENRDIVPHTATADDRSWDSGDIRQQSKRATIARGEGEQPYTCLYHPNMKGTLVVQ